MRFHISKWIRHRIIIWCFHVLHMCGVCVTLLTMFLVKFYKMRGSLTILGNIAFDPTLKIHTSISQNQW